MDDRFIKPIAAGEIVAIIAVSIKDPTGDIAAQSAMTVNVDRFIFWEV